MAERQLASNGIAAPAESCNDEADIGCSLQRLIFPSCRLWEAFSIGLSLLTADLSRKKPNLL
jgi:hypothetical protein